MAFLLLFSVSCEEAFLPEPESNTILNNYDVFGEDFQEKYGIFQVKNINWPALLEEYRLPLEANPTEAGLYEALIGLISELNDSHLYLDPNGAFPDFEGGISGLLTRQGFIDVDFKLIGRSYVTLMDSVPGLIYHGMMEGNIGYVYLGGPSDYPDDYDEYMPRLLDDLRDTKGIILDIRNNPGGEDEGSRRFAGYFTEKSAPYMISTYKIGTGANDFEEARTWTLEPTENERYLKPVVLLTNRYTVSAAETLTLALKTQAQVTHMGDTTTGAFSDVVKRQLPNGWFYGLSVGDYRNADNVSLEGIGIAPDLLVKNTKEDLEMGRDFMLEAARDALQ